MASQHPSFRYMLVKFKGITIFSDIKDLVKHEIVSYCNVYLLSIRDFLIAMYFG